MSVKHNNELMWGTFLAMKNESCLLGQWILQTAAMLRCLAQKKEHQHQQQQQPQQGWDSSAGRGSDWKARCYTDAGSSPQCGKRFFSKSQLSLQTLFWCVCSPHVQLQALTLFGHIQIQHSYSHAGRNGSCCTCGCYGRPDFLARD